MKRGGVVVGLLLALRLVLFWRQPAFPRQLTWCPAYFSRHPRVFIRQHPVRLVFHHSWQPGHCYRLQGQWQLTPQAVFLVQSRQPLPNRHPKVIFLHFRQFFHRLQSHLSGYYQRWLPKPAADLLAGIVLGQKTSLSPAFRQALQRSGTLHIVVASGYNLTVISQYPVDFAANFLGRRPALGLGFLLVWLYTLLAGWQPPVIRAAIIISFVYLAQFLGRKFAIWPAFFLAAALMLFVDPSLLASVSFQLSLAALAGILLLSPKFIALRRLPLVGPELADTLAAQILVFPLIAYHFHQLSLVAPLANMFILPLVPFLMEIGLIALFLGIIWPPLGVPLLWLGYPLLQFFLANIRWWGHWRLAQLTTPFPLALVITYYGLLAIANYQLATNNKQQDGA